MTFLPAKSFDLGHGQSAHPDFRQGFTHLIELEGFYYSVYFFHGGLSRVAVVGSISTKSGVRENLPTELLPVLRGNRIAPILAETALGDAYAYRRLAALVLVSLDQPHHPLDVPLPLAAGHDLGRAQVLLHVGGHDGIEHRVRRQAILVGLVGAQRSEEHTSELQ